MRLTLSKILVASAVFAATAFTATAAHAEKVLVRVPFNFTAAGKVCPAGEYTVESKAGQNVVTLQNNQAHRYFVWLIKPASSDVNSGKASLTFDDQGEDHVLRTIQYRAQTTSDLNRHRRSREHRTQSSIQGQ